MEKLAYTVRKKKLCGTLRLSREKNLFGCGRKVISLRESVAEQRCTYPVVNWLPTERERLFEQAFEGGRKSDQPSLEVLSSIAQLVQT